MTGVPNMRYPKIAADNACSMRRGDGADGDERFDAAVRDAMPDAATNMIARCVTLMTLRRSSSSSIHAEQHDADVENMSLTPVC